MTTGEWFDAAADTLGRENTDERGWRPAPYGWLVMRASLDPELASRRSAHQPRNAAPAMASREPLKRRFIRAAQSAIRVERITGRSSEGSCRGADGQ